MPSQNSRAHAREPMPPVRISADRLSLPPKTVTPGIMHPGRFPLFVVLLLSCACQPASRGITSAAAESSAAITVVSQRQYVVQQRLVLKNAGPGEPEKQNLWVALIRDFPPYQQVNSVVVSPEEFTMVVDEYGNHYAEFDFSHQPAGTSRTVKIETRLVVNELDYDLSGCNGNLPEEFIQPELHIESANPQIMELARNLTRGNDTACQKVRAFYDYVGTHLTYTYNARSWGAEAALGPMGSDCTEYASLLIALSRAQGIPSALFRRSALFGSRSTGQRAH